MNDDFILKEVDGSLTIDGKIHTYKAVRLVHKETNLQFGEYFQESARSPEWRAALIVYEKYKRKFDLNYSVLAKLRYYMVEFSAEKKEAGKTLKQDHLVQIASVKLKEIYNKKI